MFRFLFLLLLVPCALFAGDYSSLTSGVVEDLDGIKIVLIALGGLLIGFGVIYAISGYIMRFLQGSYRWLARQVR
jgi:hypothetical protein